MINIYDDEQLLLRKVTLVSIIECSASIYAS